MESATQELSLSCILSAQANLKKTYMIVTLFHGCSSEYEKHQADVDAKGYATFQFKDVNVESAYLSFQVFTRRMLLPEKHLGDVDVYVPDLVLSHAVPGQSWLAKYELGKASEKVKNCYLKLFYSLSSRRTTVCATATVTRDEKPRDLSSKRVPQFVRFKNWKSR